jgi:predicted nucleotidyltransferase
MDATEIVARVARVIERHGLEAIMIGNAAAAIHGAPVTTVDIDFLFRRTPANVKKLKGIAADLEATLYSPFYPVNATLRMMNDDETLQVDFMNEVSGLKSFKGLRKRAHEVRIGDSTVRVADLADIIRMKRAANRPKDRAVLDILEKTLEAAKANQEGKTGTA